jgi:hypothetical protein
VVVVVSSPVVSSPVVVASLGVASSLAVVVAVPGPSPERQPAPRSAAPAASTLRRVRLMFYSLHHGE